MTLVVEILTLSVSISIRSFCLAMVDEILALLVDCKSRPLESCMLMFIEVTSIDIMVQIQKYYLLFGHKLPKQYIYEIYIVGLKNIFTH